MEAIGQAYLNFLCCSLYEFEEKLRCSKHKQKGFSSKTDPFFRIVLIRQSIQCYNLFSSKDIPYQGMRLSLKMYEYFFGSCLPIYLWMRIM